ncbi:hypothetical protein ACEQ8H_005411 [Pleosporales sp. CAS-2024a]
MSVAGNGAPASGATEDVARDTQVVPMVMDGLSSSKVTVEYHDPSGVFPLVQEDLIARLPLRNLHWKAPTRPLRSIDSLHVDLIPSKETEQLLEAANASLASSQASTATPTRTTEEILRPTTKEKQRRHQIPGLRQTPYLRVYLLRCDDSDAYKSTARKQLRDWVKEHTPPSQSSGNQSAQENHDAYEWMILHVVVPETPAASQPRWSTSSITGEKDKSASTSRWARGTTTLFEKLRADFNMASKSAPDRIAQVRLSKERVPLHLMPAPAPVTWPPIAESPQEQERAWSDVITKWKTLILQSFDLRVSQYEEDIRKNESQRSFPGWNFNTFFMLKEGLARGFESVGLVEDALLGYDELSVGLDTVIRDQAKDDTQGGVILSHTEELYEKASHIMQRPAGGSPALGLHDDQPINAQKKDYRDLILNNNISVIDFRSYVFARQMSLLLRLGNSHSARTDLAAKLQSIPNAGVSQRSKDDSSIGKGDEAGQSEDLYSLAELCSRALNFIIFAARLLREDLVNGAKNHDVVFPEDLLNNLVRSWTFAALEQVLRETATSSLPFTRHSTAFSGKSLAFGSQGREQKSVLPSRSSSLNHGRSGEAPYAQTSTSSQVVFENGQYKDRPAPTQESATPPAKNGLQELAGTRAQLVAVQRRVLEQVGKALGWNIGWNAVLNEANASGELADVDLEEHSEGENKESEKHATPVGIAAKTLLKAASSLEQFRQRYEALSDLIVKHYMAAGQIKSAESVLGDLAALKFELGDFRAASMYFGRMASLFAESRWNTVETTMLKMHAQCLKKLNRTDEYVRTLLDLLAKSAASRMSFQTTSRRAESNDMSDWLNDDKVDTSGIFNELVQYSQRLPYDVTVQMPKYFGDITVEPHVRHYDDKDGFQLRVQFRHILEDQIQVSSAKVRLVSADSAQVKDIWLENKQPVVLKKGFNRMWLGCNVNTVGPYMIDKVVLEAQRIVFVHEPLAKAEATTPLGITTSVSAHSLKAAKKARILCFPRTESFDARIYLSRFMQIDKPRHIEVACSSGWNDITHAEIRFKSASAGLRLRTADASILDAGATIKDNTTPGVVTLTTLPAESSVTIKIPYDMETILQDLTIKIEVDYFTEKGQSQYFSSCTIPVDLPLDVNVLDHFKHDTLLSRFNIKTASHIPLQLLNVHLQSSEEFSVEAPQRSRPPSYIFARQPAAVTYKITRKTTGISRRQSTVNNSGDLELSVVYRCLKEDIQDRLCKKFKADVIRGPVHRLSRLLVSSFLDRLEEHVLPPQFEKIALLEKVDMGDFDDMGWSECLDSLPDIVREDSRAWLQKWHTSNRIIDLAANPDQAAAAPESPYPPREMIITVSLAQTHILHTASLATTLANSAIATVGQPLPATLRISHTRRWATPLPTASEPIDFIYTLEANPDTWLIAGQRRAQFSAHEHQVHEWSLLLVPLKPGVTLLPNVEIRLQKPKGKEEPDMNCETDYLSYGETITVVPNVRRSTVGIGDMSKGRESSVAWLDSAEMCVSAKYAM